MCNPLIVGLVGTGISAYSQKQQADSNYQISKNNAQVEEWSRVDAVQHGAYQAREAEIAGRQAANTARVAIGANNVDSTTGSSADLITTSNINASLDAVRLKANAARAAWGFQNEAQDTMTQARINRKTGYLGAIGTGLGGLGNAASTYSQSRAQNRGT